MGLVNHYYNERFLAEDPTCRPQPHPRRRRHRHAADPVERQRAGRAPTSPRPPRSSCASCSPRRRRRYFAEETFEYPLVDGVAAAGDLPPLDSSCTRPDYQPEQLADLEGTARLIAESGLD